MITKRLQSRLKLIKATPLQNRAKTAVKSRRGNNHIIMDEDEYDLEKHDTFFDYEEELADLKPSGEQYMEMVDSGPYIALEEKEGAEDHPHNSIVMDDSEATGHIEMEDCSGELSVNYQESSTYTDVIGFEFIQCEFVKKDGNRCKRQAPNENTICSTHKRYIEKHGPK